MAWWLFMSTGGTLPRARWPRGAPEIGLTVTGAESLLGAFRPGVRVGHLERLEGGLGNTNVAATLASGERVVLRLFVARPERAEIEVAVAQRFGERLGIPRVLAFERRSSLGCPYAIVEHAPGTRVEVHPALHDAPAEIGRVVGARLAAIHAIELDRHGFLDASLAVCEPVDLGADAYAPLIGGLAAPAVRHRLGPDTVDRLLRCVANARPLIAEGRAPPCLSHSDFGGSNLLLGDTIAAPSLFVVDWEFAFAGNPWFDVGNLLRSPLGDLPAFVDGFSAGYIGAGGHLPSRWRALGLAWDLVAWLQLAGRPRANAALIEDARRAIERTCDVLRA